MLIAIYSQNFHMYVPFPDVKILSETSAHLLAAERTTQLGQSEISFMNWNFALQLR
jgi:hypothetical protein